MERYEILDALKGQKFTLPDMKAALSSWPVDLNPHLHEVRIQVDDHLKWILSQRCTPEKASLLLPRLQKADFGLFGAYWWPHIDARSLRLLTFFVIWLFLWDDEIDACSGDLSMNMEKAQTYRAETMDFVARALGLAPQGPAPRPANVLIYSFETIGADLRDHCSTYHRKLLYDQIVEFIDASETEQRRRLSPDLPTIQEYLECRMGTSAVGAVVAMFEACQGIRFSHGLAESLPMKVLWDTTNIIVSIANDVVSLKKEVADGVADSLVPLLWISTQDLQMAVEEALTLIQQAEREFDEAASELHEIVTQNDIEPLEQLIEGLEFFCTGNLHWSLQTGRYLSGVSNRREISL